jgi:hypothetical protein
MGSLTIPSNNGLITATIKPREETYYLVTESHLSEIKSNGRLGSLFVFLASIIWGAYFTTIVSLKTGINLNLETISVLKTMSIIFLCFGIVFSLLIILFLVIVGRSLKKIISADEVNLEPIQNPDDLYILEAKYGANDKYIELSEEFNKMIKDDKLVYVGRYNDLKGDPIQDVEKCLTIRYSHKGRTYTKTIDKENTPIKLPE